MAVRLRLRRMGRKKKPFYRIVAVDSRVKRDGKYLDNLGYYNPLPDPFELHIDTDKALYWLKKGAQPTDTVRSLFRRKGIMLRWDLIRKGKSEEEIEAEFKKWEEIQQEKQKKLEAARIQKMRSQKQETGVSASSESKAEEPKAEESPAAESQPVETPEAVEESTSDAGSQETPSDSEEKQEN